MSFVKSVDGVEVFYEDIGEGDTPLILVHGLGGTGRLNFKNQLYLADKYRLIVIDLPGHGKSGKEREEYTIELYGKDVQVVIEKLDLNNCLLVGFSLGGAIVAETCKNIQKRVKGILFLDAMVYSLYQSVSPEEQIKDIIKPYEDNFKEEFKKLLLGYMGDDFNAKEKEFLLSTVEDLDKRSMISAFAGIFRWNGYDVLQQITVPMKYILAGRSIPKEYRTPELQKYDCEFLENVGHLMQAENPDAFNKLFEKRIQEF